MPLFANIYNVFFHKYLGGEDKKWTLNTQVSQIRVVWSGSVFALDRLSAV